jgi:hypothetical protein
MFSDVFKQLTDHMSAPKAEGPKATPLDEIADLAASLVEVESEEIDIRDNAGRDLGCTTMPVPAQDAIEMDVTDSLQAETEYWGEGSFVQSHPEGDVQVIVDCPSLYVLDADGEVVPNARIMAEFTDIRVEIA